MWEAEGERVPAVEGIYREQESSRRMPARLRFRGEYFEEVSRGNLKRGKIENNLTGKLLKYIGKIPCEFHWSDK